MSESNHMHNNEDRSESARLRILRNAFRFNNPATLLQVGVNDSDDAALLAINPEDSLVIASDFIRGSGFTLFRSGYLNHFDIGYYLIVANLSDLAAMGCRPAGLTTVFRFDEHVSNAEFQQCLLGMKAACQEYDTEIVGGDIGSYSTQVLAATAFGFMPTKQALLRSGALPGNLLCVNGPIGLPFAALVYFTYAKPNGLLSLAEEDEAALLRAWKRPAARLKTGQLLSTNRLATSCQDVSDGLKATIEQLSQASSVGFTVYEEQLDIPPLVQTVAYSIGANPVALALSASVDFALLFTLDEGSLEHCRRVFKSSDEEFTVIGKAIPLMHNAMQLKNGEFAALPGLAWDHAAGGPVEQFINSQA